MIQDGPVRCLAAVLSADLVGYSRLIGRDEEATRLHFNHCFDDIISPAASRCHGRVVKTMGDGV